LGIHALQLEAIFGFLELLDAARTEQQEHKTFTKFTK
jgi:hypothetical protein